MSITVFIFSILTMFAFAHSVPTTTRVSARAYQRTTLDVYRSKGIPHATNVDYSTQKKGRSIASEQGVAKIPWKVKE